ncbi:MAG: maltodextrin glucosidase [Lachnospiraceae bacterium]|nr:maltodextrin glucosidase [Lachnospiraceae bacterium]
MWFEEAVFYQIYPLGLCGSLHAGDEENHRILQILDWIPHLRKLGVSSVYFSPLFDSDYHGYDTRDYRKVDRRLGTNEDFAKVTGALHDAGIKVVLDGVFNHVGRNFWAFADVREKREASPYKDWFKIDFGGNTGYNDGFHYEAWEGHYELVKLNLENPAVQEYLFDTIREWIREYDIDGLRLDVAYCLPEWFLELLRRKTEEMKPEFFLLGEIISGEYTRLIREGRCHSATNYECYKGIYSSLNSMNLFEIGYSLNRQFGPEQWTLYKGRHLLSFVDNHDVNRLASTLTNPEHKKLAYGLIFGMPGIPCIYYGSEWGCEGRKENGSDDGLRASFEAPCWTDLTETIAAMAKARKGSKALQYGGYRQVLITNRQLIFERAVEGERVLVAVNADGNAFHADFDAGCGRAVDLISGEGHDFGGGSNLPPYSIAFWKCE